MDESGHAVRQDQGITREYMQRVKTLTYKFQVAERKRIQDEKTADEEAKTALKDASRNKMISWNCDCIKEVCAAYLKRTNITLKLTWTTFHSAMLLPLCSLHSSMYASLRVQRNLQGRGSGQEEERLMRQEPI